MTHDCEDSDGSTTLDLDKPYWSKPTALLITNQARRSFPPGLEDKYGLATICATGIVERSQSRHVVRVENPDQITQYARSVSGGSSLARRSGDQPPLWLQLSSPSD